MAEDRMRRRLMHEVLREDLSGFEAALRARCHRRLEDSRVGLLEDVLAEDGADGWGARLRERLRGRVGRRRSRGWTAAAAAAVLLIGLGAVLTVERGSKPERERAQAPEPPTSAAPVRVPRHVVQSRPLAAHQRVAGRRVLRVVASRTRGRVVSARPRRFRVTARVTVPRVTPPLSSRVPHLTDAELLAALGDRPCALVRRDTGKVELVLLDPDDAARILGPLPSPGEPRDG